MQIRGLILPLLARWHPILRPYEQIHSPGTTEAWKCGSGYPVGISGPPRMRRHFQIDSVPFGLRQDHRHRACSNPDSGEPVFLTLFRKLPRSAWLLRSKRSIRATRFSQHYAFTSRQATAVSPRYCAGKRCLHSRHHPRLGAATSKLGQRQDGRLCEFASAHQFQ